MDDKSSPISQRVRAAFSRLRRDGRYDSARRYKKPGMVRPRHFKGSSPALGPGSYAEQDRLTRANIAAGVPRPARTAQRAMGYR